MNDSRDVQARARQLFEQDCDAVYRKTDRVFAVLMVVQWLFGIFTALVISPYAWEGREKSVHLHVYAAIFLGAAISAFPILMTRVRPGAAVTRHVIAFAQMLWSALLIHLTGGRIETHFHVFGSLAFLAFYRDWKPLVTGTVVVAADHFLRGTFWPESVYGVENAAWWRFLEHAGWVVFEDVVLVMACLRAVQEMKVIALRQAEVEALSDSEREKSRALDAALQDLKRSQEVVVRSEKLAAVGQLAASVGHELRNPLAAVRNAFSYVSKRLDGKPLPEPDPRVPQFLGIADRELETCNRIITDLLDFARERPPNRRPCPLRPVVDEAIGLVPPREKVRVVNEVPDTLPVPLLDKDQFRQIVVNLVQNATEAVPPERGGTVQVRASGGGEERWRIDVTDDGTGIAPEMASKLFQPLFTTKTKGTGLGLAIVSQMVQRHGGTIRVESEPGKGTSFIIELPAELVPAGAAP